jgi:hypothetical protein
MKKKLFKVEPGYKCQELGGENNAHFNGGDCVGLKNYFIFLLLFCMVVGFHVVSSKIYDKSV